MDGDGYVTGYKVNNPGSNFTNNSNIICSKININNEDSFLDSIENTINDIGLDLMCVATYYSDFYENSENYITKLDENISNYSG